MRLHATYSRRRKEIPLTNPKHTKEETSTSKKLEKTSQEYI